MPLAIWACHEDSSSIPQKIMNQGRKEMNNSIKIFVINSQEKSFDFYFSIDLIHALREHAELMRSVVGVWQGG
jgi:uncharacterized UPF0146 family protein